MIRSVSGRLAAIDADGVVVDVGGVGLHVRCSASALASLPAIGHAVALATHLVVREDALDLYGFAGVDERRLFDALTGVNGVGPRMALAILGVDEPDAVRLAIARGDTGKLQRASGVGKRTAERVVLELRDRIAPSGPGPPGAPAAPSDADAFLEARDALVALGFAAEEADRALADADTGVNAETLIRHGLAALKRR